jgi:hypothetical protein
MTEIQQLFEMVRDSRKYPDSIVPIAGEIKKKAFFPGGSGIFDESAKISNKKIMVLGQDFDTYQNFLESLNSEKENIETNKTWIVLLKLLESCKIDPHDCFFTNVIPGARINGSNKGKSPAFKEKDFLDFCNEVFLAQLNIQKPQVILILGLHVARFLADQTKWYPKSKLKNFGEADRAGLSVVRDVKISDERRTTLILLVHPSLRSANLRHRKLNQQSGADPEPELITNELKRIHYH